MTAQMLITGPDGATARHALAMGERVTIGSSPHCAIALHHEPALAPEHILVSAEQDRCWVAAARDAAPIAVDGRPFAQGYVGWGAVITVGATRIALVRDQPNAAPRPAESGNRPSPVLIVALIAAVGWAVTTFRTADGGAAGVGVPAPELFGAAASECPADGAPASRAELFAARALAAEERYPFAPAGGVRAVADLERAAACYRAAGDEATAARAAARAERLRRRIAEDYRLAQIRLDRAIGRGDRDGVREAADALLALLGDAGGEYALALRDLRRRFGGQGGETP
ncbi:MAG: hypothetical protein D6689_22060 [Deltaproteobacteria bacterium]|nr:MAG: hypothetical protein D6689_22060 [Deltaproteobacteria bacterium]